MQDDGDDESLMTVAEVAEFFNVVPYTIRDWIRHKKINASKPGGHWRISKAEVKRRAEVLYGKKK